jgi:carbamoyltransferase
MLEVKQDFSRRERLLFGPLFALFVAIGAGILVGRWGLNRTAAAVSVVAALVIAVYYVVPGWQVAIYRGWLYAVAPVGWLVSHLLLAIVYYGILTPIGLSLRVTGYDPLSRRAKRQSTTYWIPRPEASDPKRYFRQF